MICTTHQCLVSQEDCQDHSIARAFSLHITQKLNKKEKLSDYSSGSNLECPSTSSKQSI